ncbi:MAG: efflux RND transporter permease subunit, partial [bacterium]
VDIRLKDVGTVTRTNKEREVITRVNGKESVEIEIYKEADANIVTVAVAVKDRIFGNAEQQAFVANLKKRATEPARENGEAKATEKKDGKDDKGKGEAAAAQAMRMKRMTNFMAYQLPPNSGIEQLSDQSVFIKSAVDEVKGTAIMGGVLAIIVLYIFLRRVWNTIIVAIAIPISVIATFGPMFMFDVTLNIMSLGGLALGIGMLVDNSIVVLESIHRLREEGHDIVTACVRGTSMVGGAVLASTLTTVAVFFPIVFVKGIAGQIFGDMALTVVFSLLASLAVALFLVPMLASRGIKAEYLADIHGRFSDNHILRLSIIDDFKNFKARREEQHASVLGFVAGALLRFGREVIVNLVLLLGAVLLSILKSIALLLVFVPTLLLGWIPSLRKHVRWLEAWSAQPNFKSFTIHQRVWDTLLVFKSYPILVSGWRNFAAKFKEAKLLKRIARVALFPLYLVYAVARFVIHHLFSTLLKAAL